MPLGSVAGIMLVGVALVGAVIHEFRVLSQATRKNVVVLHGGRILALLLTCFGILGEILAAAGYGGTTRTMEVDRWHPVLGNLGTGYAEAPALFGELSVLGIIVGGFLWLLCTLLLQQMERSDRRIDGSTQVEKQEVCIEPSERRY
jgi:hypothetical protein